MRFIALFWMMCSLEEFLRKTLCGWIDLLEEDEVFGVVGGFNSDKSPAPNGFSMPFSQSCWSILKSDIMDVLHNFHEQAVFERSLNVSFLALIPKKFDAMEVKGYSRMKTGVPGVICKLDVEKAYDHVKWNFLMYLLKWCGFSEKWRRGVHQGYSLSPLLFDIVMEALSHMLDAAVMLGQFSGFLLELVPTGNVPNMEELVEILGCRQSSLPLKYLGPLLGASHKEETIWNPVLERMERRLAGWKRLFLFKGGKITLIKSTLSSLPTYFLSLLRILVKVANRMEKIHRDFLWSGIDAPKVPLVEWAKVCMPVQNGGLGIR
nr:uncharacterized protein LOC112001857 [Quercus suber]